MAGEGQRDSLRSFSASRDENGQNLSDDPADQGRADDVQAQLSAEPTGDAETARLASGFTGDDGTAATEAQAPAGAVERLGDATLNRTEPKDSPLDRATASLGKE